MALSFTFNDMAQLLFMLIWIAAAVLLLSVRLGGDPYRRLRQGPLQLDESARAYLDAACTKMTGRLQALTLTGAALTLYDDGWLTLETGGLDMAFSLQREAAGSLAAYFR